MIVNCHNFTTTVYIRKLCLCSSVFETNQDFAPSTYSLMMKLALSCQDRGQDSGLYSDSVKNCNDASGLKVRICWRNCRLHVLELAEQFHQARNCRLWPSSYFCNNDIFLLLFCLVLNVLWSLVSEKNNKIFLLADR